MTSTSKRTESVFNNSAPTVGRGFSEAGQATAPDATKITIWLNPTRQNGSSKIRVYIVPSSFGAFPSKEEIWKLLGEHLSYFVNAEHLNDGVKGRSKTIAAINMSIEYHQWPMLDGNPCQYKVMDSSLSDGVDLRRQLRRMATIVTPYYGMKMPWVGIVLSREADRSAKLHVILSEKDSAAPEGDTGSLVLGGHRDAPSVASQIQAKIIKAIESVDDSTMKHDGSVDDIRTRRVLEACDEVNPQWMATQIPSLTIEVYYDRDHHGQDASLWYRHARGVLPVAESSAS